MEYYITGKEIIKLNEKKREDYFPMASGRTLRVHASLGAAAPPRWPRLHSASCFNYRETRMAEFFNYRETRPAEFWGMRYCFSHDRETRTAEFFNYRETRTAEFFNYRETRPRRCIE